MAITFNGLVSEVRQALLGFAKDQESVSALAADMTSGATTFTVDAATVGNLSRGLVEVDDELILVKSYDSTSGTVTVMGGTSGRGYEGTVAASHLTNALVTASPAFPRARIKRAINDTIKALYPDLLVFATTEITRSAVVHEYEMPAAAKDVWKVDNQTVGPTKVWTAGTRFKFNPRANTTAFPSGKSIQLFDSVTPGRAQRIVYTKEPTLLSGGSDDFETVTGYPERITDLVVLGAQKRLLPSYEAARLQMQAVEATERAALVPVASATRAVQLIASLYAERLEQEKARQIADDPAYASYLGD